MRLTYRQATPEDLPKIIAFVDKELSGDYFVPRKQQQGYLKYKTTLLALCGQVILGWAVLSKNKALIHLLVARGYRGMGIGSELLRRLNPKFIRSKRDQKAGDPITFYNKRGYSAILTAQGRKSNIDILEKIEGIPPIEKPDSITKKQNNTTQDTNTPATTAAAIVLPTP